MISKKWTSGAGPAAIAALILAVTPVASRASDVAQCVTREESEAFSLRQLQSQLMVAALSCNQNVAYNTFVQHFRPRLASAGESLKTYFRRTGGGEPALNRHVTEIANAAGLSRAHAPENFCADTWTMFLLLEDEEDQLPVIAAKHILPGAQGPKECKALDTDKGQPDPVVPNSAPTDLPIIKTVAP